jgi:hypothetical protein
MRVVLVLCLLFAAVLPGAAGSAQARVSAGKGLTVVLPGGWRLSHKPVTTCDSPEQVLLVATGHVRLRTSLAVPPHAALVLLMEGGTGSVPRRPAHFELPPLQNLGGCCEMPVGPGVEVFFRDHGRRFYAFVYIGSRARAGAARDDVVHLLDSLRVSARR